MNAGQVAEWIGAELVGDAERAIDRVRPLGEAGERDLAFLADPRHERQLRESRAGVVLCPEGTAPVEGRTLLRVANPRLAFARLMQRLHPPRPGPAGVHPSATVDPGATLAEGVCVHPGTRVGRDARVGRRTELMPGCVIGEGATIGEDCRFHPGVTVYPGCRIGDRVILHAGAVIGSDGFGYAADADGAQVKIPQTGIVIVEDDVEIGANSTVDRATLGATVIGRGTKIDNLVQVAHNVTIGPHSVICSQTGISGSCAIGAGVVMGGQVGMADHLRIGDRAMLGARCGVHANVPEGAVMLGVPARPAGQTARIFAAEGRLPEMRRELADLKARLAALEEKR